MSTPMVHYAFAAPAVLGITSTLKEAAFKALSQSRLSYLVVSPLLLYNLSDGVFSTRANPPEI